jgi:predicted PurR-regulated permease PerM
LPGDLRLEGDLSAEGLIMIVPGEAASNAGEDPPLRHDRYLRVPMTTIIRVVASGLGLWAVLLLWPGFLLFLISLILAVTLHPVVRWMERRRIKRHAAVVIIAAFAVGLLVVFVAFVLPPLTAQMTNLVRDFPDFRARIVSRIPTRYPAVQDLIRAMFESPSYPGMSTIVERSFAWGQTAVSGLVVAGVVLVLTLYLLIGGTSLYAWLLAFVPRTYREKVATTADEVSDVVHAYVGGQLLAALLFAIFTAVLLVILRVPAVAPLAVIAGVCDIIPVLGILVATVPAVLLALSVSPGTALAVLVAYSGYHLIETYLLLPRIYGNKLKISTLSVLLALLVGGRLQGIIGAVLVLPLVAAYPIIERHWLGGYLRSRVLTDHKALAKAAETGSDVAIDAVLHGEKHASEDFHPSGKTWR